MRIPCLKRNDILMLLSKGKKFYCESFILLFQVNHNINKCNNFQMTTSISASYGKSHDRNIAKRRIYNLVHGKYSNIMIWFRLNNKHKNHTSFDELKLNIEKFNQVYKKIFKLT